MSFHGKRALRVTWKHHHFYSLKNVAVSPRILREECVRATDAVALGTWRHPNPHIPSKSFPKVTPPSETKPVFQYTDAWFERPRESLLRVEWRRSTEKVKNWHLALTSLWNMLEAPVEVGRSSGSVLHLTQDRCWALANSDHIQQLTSSIRHLDTVANIDPNC